jgi:hypothetical protein
MPIRLYAIDGTGDFNSNKYTKDFENSFLNQIFHKYKNKCGLYYRGPNLIDWSMKSQKVFTTSELASLVVSAVERDDCSVDHANSDLVLAGYSRGGAAVILAAQRLASRNRKVRHMFLIDPVNRAVDTNFTDTVPRTVENVYVVRRVSDQYSILADRHERMHQTKLTHSQRLANAAKGTAYGSILGPTGMLVGGVIGALKASEISSEDRLIAQELRAAGRDEFELIVSDINHASIPFGKTGTRMSSEFTNCKVNISILGSHGAIGGTEWKFDYAKQYQFIEDNARIQVKRLYIVPYFYAVMNS